MSLSELLQDRTILLILLGALAVVAWFVVQIRKDFSNTSTSIRIRPSKQVRIHTTSRTRTNSHSRTPVPETYSTKAVAVEAFKTRLRKQLYADNFYKVEVSCDNCHLQDVMLVPKGSKLTDALCPVCANDGLRLVSSVEQADDVEPISYPKLLDEVEEELTKTATALTDEAWETGQIRSREKESLF